MCGRYVLHTSRSQLAIAFGIDRPVGDVAPRYNITPGTQITLITAPSPGSDWPVSIGFGTWGFRPAWANDKAPRPINARAETVATSRYFRDAFAHRRALIPADGWYEWQRDEDGRKQPFYTHRRNGEPLMFAGLWEPTGAGTDCTCLIITQPAAPELAHIHDRMPVALDPGCWWDWLDPAITDRQTIRAAARQLEPGELEAFPVGSDVNRPANDRPELLHAI